MKSFIEVQDPTRFTSTTIDDIDHLSNPDFVIINGEIMCGFASENHFSMSQDWYCDAILFSFDECIIPPFDQIGEWSCHFMEKFTIVIVIVIFTRINDTIFVILDVTVTVIGHYCFCIWFATGPFSAALIQFDAFGEHTTSFGTLVRWWHKMNSKILVVVQCG